MRIKNPSSIIYHMATISVFFYATYSHADTLIGVFLLDFHILSICLEQPIREHLNAKARLEKNGHKYAYEQTEPT